MAEYKVSGQITYLVTVQIVDQHVDAISEEDALEQVYDDNFPMVGADDCTWYYDDLKVVCLDDDEEAEDVKMRKLGAPTLPGFVA